MSTRGTGETAMGRISKKFPTVLVVLLAIVSLFAVYMGRRIVLSGGGVKLEVAAEATANSVPQAPQVPMRTEGVGSSISTGKESDIDIEMKSAKRGDPLPDKNESNSKPEIVTSGDASPIVTGDKAKIRIRVGQ